MKFILIFHGLVFLAWTIVPLKLVYDHRGLGLRSGLVNFASACIIFCGSAFTFFSLCDLLTFDDNKSFELPIGVTTKALKLNDGTLVVVHEMSNRIKVYDQKLDFVRSWGVNCTGNSLQLNPKVDNTFFLYGTKRKKRFLYNNEGDLISEITYKGSAPSPSKRLIKVWIPTPLYLVPFSEKVLTILPLLGFILFVISNKLKKGGD